MSLQACFHTLAVVLRQGHASREGTGSATWSSRCGSTVLALHAMSSDPAPIISEDTKENAATISWPKIDQLLAGCGAPAVRRGPRG